MKDFNGHSMGGNQIGQISVIAVATEPKTVGEPARGAHSSGVAKLMVLMLPQGPRHLLDRSR